MHMAQQEFLWYLTKKHTVFRVIIKVTEKLVLSRRTDIDNSSSEQFSTHFGVYCVIIRSLLKHTDLNITEFLTKITLLLEDCAS